MIWQRKYAEYGKLIRHQFSVTIRSPVAEKLPGIAHFTNHVQVQIGNDESILIVRSLGNDLAARIPEVALAIEFADVPRLLVSDAIDRAHEVAIRDGMRRLLKFPKIL